MSGSKDLSWISLTSWRQIRRGCLNPVCLSSVQCVLVMSVNQSAAVWYWGEGHSWEWKPGPLRRIQTCIRVSCKVRLMSRSQSLKPTGQDRSWVPTSLSVVGKTRLWLHSSNKTGGGCEAVLVQFQWCRAESYYSTFTQVLLFSPVQTNESQFILKQELNTKQWEDMFLYHRRFRVTLLGISVCEPSSIWVNWTPMLPMVSVWVLHRNQNQQSEAGCTMDELRRTGHRSKGSGLGTSDDVASLDRDL